MSFGETMDSVLSEFACKLCRKPPVLPTTLDPCHHTFCSWCISTLRSACYDEVFTCPECDEKVRYVFQNPLLEKAYLKVVPLRCRQRFADRKKRSLELLDSIADRFKSVNISPCRCNPRVDQHQRRPPVRRTIRHHDPERIKENAKALLDKLRSTKPSACETGAEQKIRLQKIISEQFRHTRGWSHFSPIHCSLSSIFSLIIYHTLPSFVLHLLLEHFFLYQRLFHSKKTLFPLLELFLIYWNFVPLWLYPFPLRKLFLKCSLYWNKTLSLILLSFVSFYYIFHCYPLFCSISLVKISIFLCKNAPAHMSATLNGVDRLKRTWKYICESV